MRTHRAEFEIETGRRFQLVDLTERVAAEVAASGIRVGFVLVFTPHTTAAIRVNEADERLHQDMERFLTELAPPAGPWRHDLKTVDGRPNAWGHVMALLMDASAVVPLRDGRLDLGPWQAVFFVELDGPREHRRACVQVMGS